MRLAERSGASRNHGGVWGKPTVTFAERSGASRIGVRCLGAALALSIALVSAGCKKPADDADNPQQASKPVPAVPKDNVESNTLVPGKEKAYALVLPLGFTVQTRLDRTAASLGAAQPKQVVTYIKERVRDGKVIESDPHSMGEERTVFEGVRIPDEPDRYLQIVVTPRRGATLITVTDVTPIPALPPASEAERYKQVGMDPQGHLLHPHSIE